jgi:hypothetical protein
MTDSDYTYYIDNAKQRLSTAKRIVSTSKGITRRGKKYNIIRYIEDYEGGEYQEAVQVFYKDDNHLSSIMKELT